jgi:hypothetical protein
MIKRLYAKIAIVCACALSVSPLGSVITSAQAKNIVNTKEETVVATSETEPIKVKSKTYKKEYKFKDGTIYKEAKYTRPVLEGESEAIAKINAYYKRLQDKWVKNSKTDLEDAKYVVKQSSVEGYYSDEATFKVKYNKNGYISILHTGYYYAMGAHGSPYYESHTFDLNTGKELKLKDIMCGTDKQIKDRIIKVFAKDIKKNKNKYFEDALKTLKKSVSSKSKDFYLTNSNIIFYDNSGNLAPYAAGLITAKISYKNSSYFKLDLK